MNRDFECVLRIADTLWTKLLMQIRLEFTDLKIIILQILINVNFEMINFPMNAIRKGLEYLEMQDEINFMTTLLMIIFNIGNGENK
jgi:hypothetical protein